MIAFKRLLQTVSPPIFPSDETKTRNAKWLTVILLTASTVSFFYIPLAPLIDPNPLQAIALNGVMLALYSSMLLLIHKRQVEIASILFSSLIWLMTTLSIIAYGTLISPGLLSYFGMIAIASLFLRRRIIVGFVGLTLVMILGFIIIEEATLLPDSVLPITPAIMGWISAFNLVVVALTSYLSLHSVTEALERAQHELVEREKMEQALRESEERYRLISSITSDYTFSSTYNAQGQLEKDTFGGAFESITGYTPEEFAKIGGWRAVLHPDDYEQDKRDTALLHQNRRVITEVRIIRNWGEIRWVQVYAYPVWDEKENRLIGINGAVRDITERRLAQEILAEREERYRIVFGMISDYAYAYDILPDGRLKASWATVESFKRVTGYDWNELDSAFTFYHPDDAELASQHVQQTLQGQSTEGEYRIITKSGQIRWLQVWRQAEWDEDHQRVIRYYGAAQDITERKEAQEAVRRNEAFLRALLNATTDVAFLMSTDGNFLTFNEAFAKSADKTVEELIGQNGFDLLTPELRSERNQHFLAVMDSKQSVRWEDVGENTAWDNHVYPVLSPSGEVEAFAVYSRNITEQKRLEAELQRYTLQLESLVEERTTELRRAKEQLELILNNTSDALAFTDASGDIMVTNPAFHAAFEEHVTRSIEKILWSLANEEQMTAVSNALLKVIYSNESQRVEAQIVSKNGAEKDVDLALIPVRLVENDTRNGVLLSGRDITQLKDIQRFKARFVADAVHDLATPIAGLSMRLYMLEKTPEKLTEHVRALENQVRHLSNLLDDLRTLSQMDRGQVALNTDTCNLNDLVLRVFDTYEPVALNKRQSLTLDIAPDLPEMRLDQRQIERVMVNLVSNAVNYSPENTQIRIKTSVETQEVVICVIDQGLGIAPEDLPHIFERFYRSSEARQTQSTGTGLGLAITREIVELHKGTINVTSELGHGSVFTVRLPLQI